MAAAPPGRMLSVALSEDELREALPGEVVVAAVNGATTCTVAGPAKAIAEVEATFERRGIATRPLRTSHAFHSAQMDGVLAPLADAIGALEPAEPTIPYLANRTGTWATDADASDPGAWSRHSREPVRFADCVATLAARHPDAVVVELGPGRALSALIASNPEAGDMRLVRSAPGRGEGRRRGGIDAVGSGRALESRREHRLEAVLCRRGALEAAVAGISVQPRASLDRCGPDLGPASRGRHKGPATRRGPSPAPSRRADGPRDDLAPRG